MFPDVATRECLYQMVGYTLFAQKITPKDASLFILYGKGANGKGTLQHILTSIVGEAYTSYLDLCQVTSKFTSNMLDDHKINFCSDATSKSSAETHVDSGVLKAMATGEPVIVQRKNERPYVMYNQAKLWFFSNSPPDLGGIDGGVVRRLHIIHMTTEFNTSDNIQSVLYSKRGVQWFAMHCLGSYKDFLANDSRFADSRLMLAERRFYTSYNNNVYDFLDSRYTLDAVKLLDTLDGTLSSDLYQEYKVFCSDMGNKKLSAKRFYSILKTDFKITKSKVNAVSMGKRTTREVFVPLVTQDVVNIHSELFPTDPTPGEEAKTPKQSEPDIVGN